MSRDVEAAIKRARESVSRERRVLEERPQRRVEAAATKSRGWTMRYLAMAGKSSDPPALGGRSLSTADCYATNVRTNRESKM